MEKLRQILAQDDTVLFIGSGISLWSGLPSWSKLIDELADFINKAGGKADLVRKEAHRGDLLQAASYGFDQLTKPQIGDFIRSACQYGISKPHEIHRKIVSLGPRCFVTTNYDNLIEESLRLWKPDRFFLSVTNRNLTETAEIVHARAIDFVFKPHGDAADSESIILTREQYRQLLPGGERQNALEAVKMLLASRPVVYLGFGLRDPDFMYIRDILSNTFKGGVRDHYAIIADTTDEEADYWRRNYGIHIINYQTTDGSNGLQDHNALLKLLDDLLVSTPIVKKPMFPAKEVTYPPELILALARHAGRLTQFTKNEPEFMIRVHLEKRKAHEPPSHYRLDEFDHSPVDRFLEEGPDRALLTGPPGAGKTYSLKRSSVHIGEELNKACLAEKFDEKDVLIPIFADLKLYRGDLQDLIEQTLPSGLTIAALNIRFKLKIFLDSFNEMPREQLESGAYEADFARFIGSLNNATLIVSSRTSDGLAKLDFPSYCLDHIDEESVIKELQRSKAKIDGRFEREVLRLLQNPFYFQLYISGKVKMPQEPHPRDIFQSFFKSLTNSYESHFDISFDLERTLSIVAYNAMNSGQETLQLTQILQILRNQLQEAGVVNIDSVEVANWLVSKSVFIPYIGGMISFFHQSITEFLAASELARKYQTSPEILQEKLSLTYWDKAIYLALSFLTPEIGETFLRAVIEKDFSLALEASKYLEAGRDEVVTKLLSEIPDRIKDYGTIEDDIVNAFRYGVPVSDVHEPLLRKIMACGNMIGAAAVELLTELKGASIKDELLQSMIDCRDDYNYCCNGLAPAISPFIETEDLKKLVIMADSIEEEVTSESDEKIAHGFTSGVRNLLSSIDIEAIRDAFLPSDELKQVSEVRARILCNILLFRGSTAALELAAELLLRGVNKAATAISFISIFSRFENNLSWSSFNKGHVNHLLSILLDADEEVWAFKALRCLCAARPDLAETVGARALNEHGLLKAILLFSCTPNDSTPIFNALTELADMNDEQRRKEPILLLNQVELDWTGHEELLVRLLKLGDVKLALALINQIKKVGKLEIGSIEWWLDWLMNVKNTDLCWWLRYRISRLFEKSLSIESRKAFVVEFNRPGSKYRKILANSILLAQDDLNTDSFSEEAISFLIESLAEKGAYNNINGHLLGKTATELFVTKRLLPMLSTAKEPIATNLRRVLIYAGSRHGRRYVAN